jgi:hypothetical protein
MNTNLTTTTQTTYTALYKYLLVMNEEQITRLRKIVTGNLSLNVFSDQEVHVLEAKLLLTTNAPAR